MPSPPRMLLATGALLLVAAGLAQGATIPVTTTLDGPITGANDGLCSLREAVAAAVNDGPVQGCPAGSGADTVALGAGTFTLSAAQYNEDQGFAGDLDVGGPPVRVVGAGAGATEIRVTFEDRAFDVRPGGDLTLEALTVRGGRLPEDTGASGAGVRNQGTLTVVRSVFEDNVAGSGGDTGLDGGEGGAIWSGNPAAETVSVLELTFTNNRAGDGGAPGEDGGDGGAIRIASATLSVARSTFTTNQGGSGENDASFPGTGGNGGAIAVGPGTATITSSTFASNRGGAGGVNDDGVVGSAGGNGGAVGVSGGGQALIEWSTFLGNARGLGSAGPNGISGAIVGSSILADAEPRCAGVVASVRNLLSGPDGACLPGSLVGDPRLGPLANNGGPTPTLLPGPGSAAIDALVGAGCPATDQRGLPRPALGACDAGAVEVQPSEPGAVGVGGGRAAPTLGAARRVSALALSPAAFRAAGSGGSIGTPPRAKSLQAKAPIGTAVRYRLDGAARVTFTVTRALPGRRKGARCVAPGAAKPGAKRCVRTKVLPGSIAHQGAAGPNSFRFTGRLRGRKLAPGPYRLVARLPKPAAGKAATTTKAFRILRA